eukprot:25211_1
MEKEQQGLDDELQKLRDLRKQMEDEKCKTELFTMSDINHNKVTMILHYWFRTLNICRFNSICFGLRDIGSCLSKYYGVDGILFIYHCYTQRSETLIEEGTFTMYDQEKITSIVHSNGKLFKYVWRLGDCHNAYEGYHSYEKEAILLDKKTDLNDKDKILKEFGNDTHLNKTTTISPANIDTLTSILLKLQINFRSCLSWYHGGVGEAVNCIHHSGEVVDSLINYGKKIATICGSEIKQYSDITQKDIDNFVELFEFMEEKLEISAVSGFDLQHGFDNRDIDGLHQWTFCFKDDCVSIGIHETC